MIFDLQVLYGAALFYLFVLFSLAYITDSGLVSVKWVQHPVIYVLSLGVYATSWSYYGSVGLAQRDGYLFLTIYLGVTLAFLLAPVILKPILRLTRDYQLTSLADLFVFRYRSQAAGVLVTLFMLVGALPYIALQIRAVTETVQVLTQEATPQMLALVFCATLILFAILFGARHASPREKHHGLVAAIAFETAVKLLAILLVGLYAVNEVFGGAAGLAQWLAAHPEAVERLYAPAREGPWLTLIFLAFAASFLLPRQFHMLFTENFSARALNSAAWGFPLLLLLLNLAIPPILWAGTHLRPEMNPDYYLLGIVLDAPTWLPVLAFIGGVSSASAMVIVSTLALSSMCLNHLVLPASPPTPKMDLYRWLLAVRRVLIALIILAGFGFYQLLEHNQGLADLGLISFVAVAQFVPGLLGVLFWARANRIGFIAGLAGGVAMWFLTLLAPLLHASGILQEPLSLVFLRVEGAHDPWAFATFWSLTVNSLLFVGFSLWFRQSAEERETARACRSDTFLPLAGVVAAHSPGQFVEGLSATVGREAGEREVAQALQDLDLAADESRPAELRRLRERIERNLSGLLGPQMAHMVINQQLALDSRAKTALADSMRFVEERLQQSRSAMKGVTAELDALRRYHRQILLDLPLGVCAVEADRRVVIWNLALEVMSGVPNRQAVGRNLQDLPHPWSELLAGFARAGDEHVHHLEVQAEGRKRWFNLHKARVWDTSLGPGGGAARERSGLVMLLEDLTDLETLEAELAHTDRLASIGRLAAGVAHEIGNPVTGIASLAQNLREEHDPAEIERSIDAILQQTRRISGIVQSLSNFSRSGAAGLEPARFPLDAALSEALSLVQLTHKAKRVTCDCSCPAGLVLNGDRQRLSQVLVNLLSNACDASRPGDRVDVIVIDGGEEITLEIMDQGQGIPQEHRELVFEPFFTTKPAGEGTGLGLPLVYKIVQEHGGRIELDSAPGVGTRVIIHLPKH